MKAWFSKLWAKIVSAISKYNWKLVFIGHGIDGFNTATDKIWLVYPSLFTRANKFTNSVDIGIVWFGFGGKLNITKK